ncbi:unnamed protein product [Heterobilharzia americana]|nr:unnamed protein product [Heterobilharzia americana]
MTHLEFGVFGDGKFVQRGWLMSNSEIHIRLSSTSCKFFKNNICAPHNQLFVSCSRFILQPTCIEDEDAESLTRDTPVPKSGCLQDQGTPSCGTELQSLEPSSLTLWSANRISYPSVVCRPHPVFMSTLEINRCRVHRGEQPECSGTPYKIGDDVTFFIETWDVENTSVEIEFYQQQIESSVNDTKTTPGSQLKFIGSARLGPFVDTYGRKAAQILNSSHSPVGDLRVRYLIIQPMIKPPDPSLKVSYQHHWKKRGVIDIGHRGMGTSFLEPEQKQYKRTPSTKENTLDSFRTAVQHGADFVEMDLYRKRKEVLNYDDLRELNVRHSSVLKESHSHEKMNEEDLDPVELQPFPLLRSCFQEIDPDLGFVIEVKYPMEFKEGGSEMDHFFEYNFYVDTILREILNYGGSRRILLSCFDPNVAAMLQLKQNIYPVFQLGISPEYADTRHANFERLFWSAISHQLMGVCLESDKLLDVPDVIKLAHSHNLVVLAWGEAVNSPEKRALLIQLGVDGIIYDCLHENKAKGSLSRFKQERFTEKSSSSLTNNDIQSISDLCYDINLEKNNGTSKIQNHDQKNDYSLNPSNTFGKEKLTTDFVIGDCENNEDESHQKLIMHTEGGSLYHKTSATMCTSVLSTSQNNSISDVMNSELSTNSVREGGGAEEEAPSSKGMHLSNDISIVSYDDRNSGPRGEDNTRSLSSPSSSSSPSQQQQQPKQQQHAIPLATFA